MSDAGGRTELSVLGFDFGLRWIGTAVGQTATGTASPLGQLDARDGTPNWEQVRALLEEWQPDLLVVGLPLNMDGSESDMARRARRFGHRLHGRYGRAVEFVDERLSSREAMERAGPGARREDAHALAAQVILEGWLAEHAREEREDAAKGEQP